MQRLVQVRKPLPVGVLISTVRRETLQGYSVLLVQLGVASLGGVAATDQLHSDGTIAAAPSGEFVG